jgi:hypothetical protein
MKLFITFLFLANLVSAQDTSFVKSFYGGSKITIPKSKTWVIEKAFVSGGDGYNIQINLSHFKSEYKSEETLLIPYYIPEMELLSDKNMVSYFLTIIEKSTKK